VISGSRHSFFLAAFAAVVALSGCGVTRPAAVATNHQNHQPAELTRRQSAGQFVCREDDVTVRELRNAEYQANGCGGASTGASGSGERTAKNTRDATTAKRPFPRDDARTALRAAARGLRSCSDATPLSFDAHLRFEPTGKVSEVAIPANEIAQPIATCVKTRLTEVALTPFDGDPVTVRMRVEL
jgi:hypothetical protein